MKNNTRIFPTTAAQAFLSYFILDFHVTLQKPHKYKFLSAWLIDFRSAQF